MQEARIKEIMEGVISDARQNFWVDPETHFIHHSEMENWIKTFGIVKKSVLVSFVTGVFAGSMGIFWVGFKAYMKLKGKISNRSCPECGAGNHDDDAEYCKCCGVSL